MEQSTQTKKENAFFFNVSLEELKASWDYSSHHSGLYNRSQAASFRFIKQYEPKLKSLLAHAMEARETCMELEIRVRVPNHTI